MLDVRTSLKKTQLISMTVHWKSDLSAETGHLLEICDDKHVLEMREGLTKMSVVSKRHLRCI